MAVKSGTGTRPSGVELSHPPALDDRHVLPFARLHEPQSNWRLSHVVEPPALIDLT